MDIFMCTGYVSVGIYVNTPTLGQFGLVLVSCV